MLIKFQPRVKFLGWNFSKVKRHINKNKSQFIIKLRGIVTNKMSLSAVG